MVSVAFEAPGGTGYTVEEQRIQYCMALVAATGAPICGSLLNTVEIGLKCPAINPGSSVPC